MKETNETTRRFVGIDLSKRTYTLAIITPKGKVLQSNGMTTIAGRQKLYGKLEATDKVALEAGNMAFIIAKELIDRVGCEVRVLNAAKVPEIYGSMKKTDKEDALKLARIVEERRDEWLPAVGIPSDQELYRRRLLSSYKRERKARTMLINRLHALFWQQGVTTVVRKDLATDARRQEQVQQLSSLEREEGEDLVKHLALHEARLAVLKKQIVEESTGDETMHRLQTIPGVGLLVAFAFSAYVGDGTRFEKGGQVGNYLGLVPRVYASGQTERLGGITKRGNSYLRSLLVQAAWAVGRCKEGGALKERWLHMTDGGKVRKKKSATALARRIGVLMWTLARKGGHFEDRSGTGQGGTRGASGKPDAAQLARLAATA